MLTMHFGGINAIICIARAPRPYPYLLLLASESEVGTWWLRAHAPYAYHAEHALSHALVFAVFPLLVLSVLVESIHVHLGLEKRFKAVSHTSWIRIQIVELEVSSASTVLWCC